MPEQLTISGFELPPYALVRERRPRAEPKKRREPGAPNHLSIVYEALEAHGDQTVAEMATHCALTARQIHRRMADLERVGIAKVLRDEAGEPVMRESLAGHVARVWSVR